MRGLLALVALVAATAQADADDVPAHLRHPYGHLVLDGAVQKLELFRATFGGLLPCGAWPLVVAHDHFGCDGELAGRAAGALVVAHRGNCTFLRKALNAQLAGAVGLILVNHEGGLIRVTAGNITTPFPLSIPVAMVSNATWPVLSHYAKHAPAPAASLLPQRDVCAPVVRSESTWVESLNTTLVTAYDHHLTGSGLVFCNGSAVAAAAAPAEAIVAVDGSSNSSGAENGTAPDAAAAGVPGNITRGACMLDSRTAPSQKAYTAQLLAAVHGNAAAAEPGAGAAAESGTGTGVGSVVAGAPPTTIVEAATLSITVRKPASGGDAGSCASGPVAATFEFEAATATFSGPVNGATARVMLAAPLDACAPLVPRADNATDEVPPPSPYAGAYVVVARGGCTMVDKARNAQAAGAVGVLIANGDHQDAVYAPADLLVAAPAAGAASGAGPQRLAVGIVRAIGDDHLKENPVNIPAAMLSAHAFYALRASVDATVGGTADARQWEACVSGRLQPTDASVDAWDSIVALARPSHKWGNDQFQRQREILRLLRVHYPLSATGSAERFALLKHYAAAAGGEVAEELDELAHEITWDKGRDIAAHAGLGRSQYRGSGILEHTSIASLHLTGHLPVSRLHREQADVLMHCRSDTGNNYNVKLAPPVLAGLTSPTRKISEALAQQACLEKLLMVNGAALGSYLALLRHELDAEEWARTTASLLRPWRVPADEAQAMAARYIELSTLYETEMPMAEDITIARWTEAATQ